MKSAFRRDVFRQIRTSKRRFVAILLIVALGVAFFSGVRATSPDMRMTLDQYFDDYNAADVQLLSTLGFDEEDLTALREVEGMRIVQPGYAADGFLQRGGYGPAGQLSVAGLAVSAGCAGYGNQPSRAGGGPLSRSGERMPDRRRADR